TTRPHPASTLFPYTTLFRSGRPGADPGVAHDQQDQGAEGTLRPYRADGRAELPPGDPHRRPRLHHRARRDRVRRRRQGARAERAGAQLLPGYRMRYFALLLWAVFAAHAQDYPVRAVRMLVGYPPGGGMDTIARIIAPKISEALGQQFVVENRPGASGGVAAEALVKSTPDGHVLMVA